MKTSLLTLDQLVRLELGEVRARAQAEGRDLTADEERYISDIRRAAAELQRLIQKGVTCRGDWNIG